MAIVTGKHPDYKRHCKVMVGAYCEVHNEPSITNTEDKRTTSAIALGHAPGNHDAYFFMSLQTGKKI